MSWYELTHAYRLLLAALQGRRRPAWQRGSDAKARKLEAQHGYGQAAQDRADTWALSKAYLATMKLHKNLTTTVKSGLYGRTA